MPPYTPCNLYAVVPNQMLRGCSDYEETLMPRSRSVHEQDLMHPL